MVHYEGATLGRWWPLIGIDVARELLDFRGPTRAISESAAEEQLKGAVALHNILSGRNVAYLADEVGMGKTYVALGALALFRHFDPNFRVLVIAPRENIQKKWMKELRNFVRNNVRFPDLRMKAVHGAPARPAVACNSLIELVRETALNPDRDFFVRLTSFSLPLGGGRSSIDRYREELGRHLPWLNIGRLDVDMREKDAIARFKDSFARTICAALPTFDLVIMDEGHNLKHGFSEKVAARNRVLAFALGHAAGQAKAVAGYQSRARRVLFLSATPLENDYVQLWNQLEVFGFGHLAPALVSEGASDEEKRTCAQQFLIRRVTAMTVGERVLTKNLYRREWRRGGVCVHDDPLEAPQADRDRQRLIVALVQKKVSELLGHERFNNSFQIGMLASFESFFETAKVKKTEEDEEPSTFDDAEQAEDAEERLGVDVGAVNSLARSYRKRFGTEMPHPKMDALVEQLSSGFPFGRKALVFVRRVASVKELEAKLEERYDEWLISRLRSELPEMRERIDKAYREYRDERTERRNRQLVTVARDSGELEEGEPTVRSATSEEDRGGLDSFFAWFFRGEGPRGILSGAALQRRFTQASSAYSTFFEDNYVSALLDVQPGKVLSALAAYLGLSDRDVITQLRTLAEPLLPAGRKDTRIGRLHLFFAVQEAALSLLAGHAGPLRERAEIVRQATQDWAGVKKRGGRFPGSPDRWLEEPTFFTELRKRPALRARLWPEPSLERGSREAFREQELRRLLLSGIARLGHAFIDLWVLAVRRIGSLRTGAREEEERGMEALISAYTHELQRQMDSAEFTFRAYRELSLASEHFALIVAVNAPDLWTKSQAEAIRDVARLVGRQQPIGGMFGEINITLVRQFRLPGYPLVLVTTDLLQEGEDLHTFCSAVYHYGISWMPSSMEQRVGRIDRVNSETERRLMRCAGEPSGDDKLQVYYPHLRDTVEVLQVRRVLSRIDQFLRLMHRDLILPEDTAKRISIDDELRRFHEELTPITEPLTTAFPIRPELLAHEGRGLVVDRSSTAKLNERFARIKEMKFQRLAIRWETQAPEDSIMGTVLLGSRQQPFTLLLHSLAGRPMVRCISPIGRLSDGYDVDWVAAETFRRPVQVAAIYDPRFETYNLTIERETLLGEEKDDLARIDDLIEEVVEAADILEKRLLERDEPLTTFRRDLERESDNVD
jgi:hypothetical protein